MIRYKYSPEFEKFWDAYPRKRNKRQAQKAWRSLKPNTELQERILEAIAVQKKSKDWLKQGGEFIPHPSTWLNADAWDNVERVKPAYKLPSKSRYEIDLAKRRAYLKAHPVSDERKAEIRRGLEKTLGRKI